MPLRPSPPNGGWARGGSGERRYHQTIETRRRVKASAIEGSQAAAQPSAKMKVTGCHARQPAYTPRQVAEMLASRRLSTHRIVRRTTRPTVGTIGTGE